MGKRSLKWVEKPEEVKNKVQPQYIWGVGDYNYISKNDVPETSTSQIIDSYNESKSQMEWD